jgi:hypothetical protein
VTGVLEIGRHSGHERALRGTMAVAAWIAHAERITVNGLAQEAVASLEPGGRCKM